MKVLSVASEMYPLIKTGGLADVVGALPIALAQQDVDMRVLLPGYSGVLEAVERCGKARPIDLPLGPAQVERCIVDRVTVWVLDAPDLYDRPGGPYLGPDDKDHPDNWKRFALLAQAGAQMAQDGAQGWRPDVVHAHNWQAGLVAAYLRAAGSDVPCVQTIHNIAFSGQYPGAIFSMLDLPERLFFTSMGSNITAMSAFSRRGWSLPMRSPPSAPPMPRNLPDRISGAAMTVCCGRGHGISPAS